MDNIITCKHCGEIVSKPILVERELNIMKGDIECDVPVIYIFCNEQCELDDEIENY